jgi:tetratricopeptide (TPR) repeat protein
MRTLLALALLAFAASASAQDDAQAAFDEGVQALRMEQYEQAAAAFQRSYDLEAKAETACNLALTYDRWEGHSEDAIDAYLQCAQDDESGRFRDHALARASALRSERHPAEAEELPPATDEGDAEDEGDEGDEGDGDAEPVPVVEHGDAPAPRSRTLLFVGGATAVVGLALVAGGAIIAGKGRDRIDQLRIDYPDGVITDPEGAAILDDAETLRSRALGFYVAGGIVAAAGIALAAIDLARGSSDDGVALAPTRGGAMATLRLSFD